MTAQNCDSKSDDVKGMLLSAPSVMISSPRGNTETGSPIQAIGRYETLGANLQSIDWFLTRRAGTSGAYQAYKNGVVDSVDNPRPGIWKASIAADANTTNTTYQYKLRVVMTLAVGTTHENEESPITVVAAPLVSITAPAHGDDGTGGLTTTGSTVVPAVLINVEVFDIVGNSHGPATAVASKVWTNLALTPTLTGEGHHLEFRVQNPATGTMHNYTVGGLVL